jgi:hypothetical protein
MITAVVVDEVGDFSIRVPEPGSYRLAVSRIGYPTTGSPAFEVSPEEQIEVTFRLDPAAVLLSPLTVEARSGARRGRDDFARRCAEYEEGRCLDPISVALLEPTLATDLFWRIPGIIVAPMYGATGPMALSQIGGGCLTIFIDHNPTPFDVTMRRRLMTPGVRGLGSDGVGIRKLFGGMFALDEVLSALEVRAVEVYMDWDEIPRDFLDGPKGWAVRPENFLGRCSVVQIWTGRGW